MAAQTIDRRDTVIAFDDDLVGGIEIAALTAGQIILAMAFFVETALTHGSGSVSVKLGSNELGVCYFDDLLSESETEIGAVVSLAAVRATASPISVVAKGLTGTWTGGSIRISTLVTDAA